MNTYDGPSEDLLRFVDEIHGRDLKGYTDSPSAFILVNCCGIHRGTICTT